MLEDIEAINKAWGRLYVFAYLYHVTDASFVDVKCYAADGGWGDGVGD